MSKILALLTAALFVVCSASAQKTRTPAQACGGLSHLDLTKAKVLSAQIVEPGAFTPPSTGTPWLIGSPDLYKTLGSFCRVVVQAAPSADSDIQIEVWLPAEGWNGNLLGQGNGGFAGEFDYRRLALAVQKKYASAATNTGHSAGGTDGRWALGHPEKVIDFGYRGIHEMTQTTKTVVNAF